MVIGEILPFAVSIFPGEAQPVVPLTSRTVVTGIKFIYLPTVDLLNDLINFIVLIKIFCENLEGKKYSCKNIHFSVSPRLNVFL